MIEKLYPLSAAAGLEFVSSRTGQHAGFDTQAVEKALGAARFAALMKGVQSVFCCDHRKYDADHKLAGYEAHCLYAKDVEDFLAGEKANA